MNQTLTTTLMYVANSISSVNEFWLVLLMQALGVFYKIFDSCLYAFDHNTKVKILSYEFVVLEVIYIALHLS